MWLKQLKMETIHGLNQQIHLSKYINAKQNNFACEFLTIEHYQMPIHALEIDISLTAKIHILKDTLPKNTLYQVD
jgi:hypothetical protein